MIQVDRLTKYFGDRPATRDLSFCIEPGSVVGFLGLNGAGKTTTLRMLAGDLAPSAGGELRERVSEAAAVGLETVMGQLARHLSHGYRQRLGIA